MTGGKRAARKAIAGMRTFWSATGAVGATDEQRRPRRRTARTRSNSENPEGASLQSCASVNYVVPRDLHFGSESTLERPCIAVVVEHRGTSLNASVDQTMHHCTLNLSDSTL